MRRWALVVCVATVALGLAVTARAQDFAAPMPACDRSPAALLERGLAPASPSLEISALGTRWHGLAELVTRSVVGGAGWGPLRLAAGLSQTGDPELGWSAAGLGAGAAGAHGGVTVRGLARRAGTEGSARGASVEAGAGAWARATSGVDVWASAPQVWTGGDPPPLERWLEIGAVARAPGAMAWVARAAAPGAPRGLRAEHLAGVGLDLGPLGLWIEARDHPARGALGVAGRLGTLRVASAVESHPVLGETVRVALTLGGRGAW